MAMRKIIDIGRNFVDADGDLELVLRMDDGTTELLCPADMLGPMLLMFASALARSQDETAIEGTRAVWPTEDVDVAHYHDGSLGLSFRLEGGGHLSFQVPLPQLEKIATALRSTLETATTLPPPGTPKH